MWLPAGHLMWRLSCSHTRVKYSGETGPAGKDMLRLQLSKLTDQVLCCFRSNNSVWGKSNTTMKKRWLSQRWRQASIAQNIEFLQCILVKCCGRHLYYNLLSYCYGCYKLMLQFPKSGGGGGCIRSIQQQVKYLMQSKVNRIILGQRFRWQTFDSLAGPRREQPLPPWAGVGLLHWRLRYWCPWPHVFVQEP